MNLEWLHFDQLSLIVAVLGVISCIRSKNVWLMLIAGISAFLTGPVSAAIFGGLLLGERLMYSTPNWMKVKDSLSLFFIICGAALPHQLGQLLSLFGVVGMSIHGEQDGLATIAPLIFAHIYFPTLAFPELVLGAFGFLLVLREVFILSKYSNSRRVLQWLEIPALICILYPFKDYAALLEDQEMLIIGGSLSGLLLLFYSLYFFKPEGFAVFSSGLRKKGEQMLVKSMRVIPERPLWKHVEPVESEKDREFENSFWTALVVVAVYAAIIILVKGEA